MYREKMCAPKCQCREHGSKCQRNVTGNDLLRATKGPGRFAVERRQSAWKRNDARLAKTERENARNSHHLALALLKSYNAAAAVMVQKDREYSWPSYQFVQETPFIEDQRIDLPRSFRFLPERGGWKARAEAGACSHGGRGK